MSRTIDLADTFLSIICKCLAFWFRQDYNKISMYDKEALYD